MESIPDTGLSGKGPAIPELPNFITFIHHGFKDQPWAEYLYQWENVIFSFLAVSLLTVFFFFCTRQREMIPSGLQNFAEWIVEILEQLIVGIIGPSGRKYLPFLGTIFIYTLTMNLLGLIPFMKSPSASLNITVAQALTVFVLVQFLSIKNMGPIGYLYHLAGSPKSGVEWAMVPLMFPIELITQISRPVTLAFRLFGNILGEEMLIGYFALLGAMALASYQIYIGFPLQLPFVFLALLTSTMQALVFTLLSAVYILFSLPDEDHAH